MGRGSGVGLLAELPGHREALSGSALASITLLDKQMNLDKPEKAEAFEATCAAYIEKADSGISLGALIQEQIDQARADAEVYSKSYLNDIASDLYNEQHLEESLNGVLNSLSWKELLKRCGVDENAVRGEFWLAPAMPYEVISRATKGGMAPQEVEAIHEEVKGYTQKDPNNADRITKLSKSLSSFSHLLALEESGEWEINSEERIKEIRRIYKERLPNGHPYGEETLAALNNLFLDSHTHHIDRETEKFLLGFLFS
jgi:hypothetical protein